jgi:putative flippase GtrA
VGALSRFLAVGCVGLAVDATTYTGINGWLGVPAVSRLFSLLLATSVTWQLNRHVTFRAAGRHRAAQALRYTIVAATSQSISYATFLLLIAAMPTIPHLLALLTGAVLGAVVGFSGQSIFGFRDRPMTIAKDRNEQ